MNQILTKTMVRQRQLLKNGFWIDPFAAGRRSRIGISSSSSRADGPDFSRFFLGPVPQQLFHGPAVDPNGAARTRPLNPPERERYNPRLITEARSPGRKRDTGSQSAGESFTLCDVAKMLVRCRGSESLSQLNKFYADPLEYFKFIRHVKDRILSIYEKSDPGHALYLLLEATGGRAHKLISSCVMLAPERGLSEALHLLYKTFGSPQVAVRSFIESLCNGSPIANTEVGLQNFYLDLISCKIVLEAVGAHNLLNAASTAEKIFLRLPHALQEGFVKLAAERGFDLEVVPFDLFIEYVEYKHKLMWSRFGRLLQPHNHKNLPRVKPDHKVKANLIQTALGSKKSLHCFCCGSVEHRIALCENFLKLARPERKGLIWRKRLCFICLGGSHGEKDCQSKSRCQSCSGKHHFLLHLEATDSEKDKSSSEASVEDKISTSVLSSASVPRSRTRLQVLPACIINNVFGVCKDTLALLDSGADRHLISRDSYDKLGLDGRLACSEMQLANGRVEKFNTYLVECAIRGTAEDVAFSFENVPVINQLPDLAGSIPRQADITKNSHLGGVKIPDLGRESKVHVILEMDSPALDVFSEIRQDGNCSLWAWKTPLGWVLHGRDLIGTEESCRKVNFLLNSKAGTALNSICPCQFDYVDRSCDPDILLPSLDDRRSEKIINESCILVDGHYQIGIH